MAGWLCPELTADLLSGLGVALREVSWSDSLFLRDRVYLILFSWSPCVRAGFLFSSCCRMKWVGMCPLAGVACLLSGFVSPESVGSGSADLFFDCSIDTHTYEYTDEREI